MGIPGTKEMKKIKPIWFVVLVILLLLIIVLFNSFNASRFATLGLKEQSEYIVQLNFSYTNPGNFNGTWNGIVLYLEELSESNNTPEYINQQLSASGDLFNSKNIFYSGFYSTFYQDYKSWITPNIRKQILKDSNFSKNLDVLLGGGNLGDNGNSENLNTLNDFIKHFKITNSLYEETSDGQIGIEKAEVEANTLSSYRKLVLKNKSVYKFGLAIINNRLIINTNEYTVFPFTISDFRFTTIDISNIVSNPSGTPEDLSVYVTFLPEE